VLGADGRGHGTLEAVAEAKLIDRGAYVLGTQLAGVVGDLEDVAGDLANFRNRCEPIQGALEATAS